MSEEKKEQKDKPTEEKVEKTEEKKEKTELELLQEKYDELQKKYEEADKNAEDWKNKYYLAYADMSNTRKQVEKETAEFKMYAQKNLIQELIPALDSFDMAMKTEPKDPNIKNYWVGFKMIQSKLLNVLTSVGVSVIEPKVGDEFDPNTMNALYSVEATEANKVSDIFTKGYKLNEHLLNPAGVVVTIKKAEEKKEDKVEEEKKVK